MRKAERRLFAVVLAVFLLISSVSSASMPIPVSLLTDYHASGPLKIIISEPEVIKLAQFDENRTEQLNKLISHIAIELNLDHDYSAASIRVDQKEAFSFLQNTQDNNTERIYSFDSSVIHEEQAEPEKSDEDSFSTFLDRILIKSSQYMDQFYSLFASAPEAFPDRVRKEGTELRFSGFGKAVQRVTVSFPADYVQENFPKALADLADSGECRELISGLSFSGVQKIGLLYTSEGKIVRISYDGKVGQSPDTLRKVALVWKCLREDEHRKDSVSLKTPAVTGADKDNIAIERDLDSTDSNAGVFNWDIQIDHRAGKEDKKQTHFSAKLDKAESVIGGKMEYSVKRDGQNPKIKIIPEIREESNGEYKGTLEFADYSGKIEKNRFLIHVQLQEGESVSWPGSELKKAKETKPETDQKEDGADSDLENTMAGILIQALFELPEEDLIYFSNEIPAPEWLELFQKR